jgi:hypothetical protein
MDPRSQPARVNLADALLRQGRREEAVLSLKEHLSIYPGDRGVEEALQALSR